MSLDFVILGNDGSPKHSVELGMEDFMAIAEKSRVLNLFVISQMDDYYSDFIIKGTDIEECTKECFVLQNEHLDLKDREFLSKLIELCNIAVSDGSEIEVLAD